MSHSLSLGQASQPARASGAVPAAIAFVHIPKTAGISILNAFARALGPANCRRMAGPVCDADFTAHRFISGHQSLCSVTRNAWRFTFLRDPVAQLASHMRWLDRFNDPRHAAEVARMPQMMRQIMQRLGRTDLGSAPELRAFFAWMPDTPVVLFGNVQSIVLSRRQDRPVFGDAGKLAAAAIHALRELQFVGLTETAPADMARLFRKLHLPQPPVLERDNTESSPRRIDIADPAIRAVLQAQMQADQRLYDHVLRRRRTIVLKL